MTEVTQGIGVFQDGLVQLAQAIFGIAAIIMLIMLISGIWIQSMAEKWKLILIALLGSILLALAIPSIVEMFTQATSVI